MGRSIVRFARRFCRALLAFCMGVSAGTANSPSVVPSVREPNSTIRMPLNTETVRYTAEVGLNGLTFEQPVGLASPPGETNRLFILEKAGRIMVVTNLAAPTATSFLDLSDRVVHEQESGLLGMAFHPEYTSNRTFFVIYTLLATTGTNAGLHFRLSRFETASDNPNRALPESETPLITQFDGDPWHQAGNLQFGPDGYLYVSLGDGGSRYRESTQRIDRDFFSGILRLDVDNRPGSLPPNPHPSVHGNYSIPPDNPFIGITHFNGLPVDPHKVRTEFYAVGLRNPWRFCFDPATGNLYSNDTGDVYREEVNLIFPGANYGWPWREGSVVHAEEQLDGFIPPLAEYGYPGGEAGSGKAIAAGLFYRGDAIPALKGSYLFSDFWMGDIGAVHLDGSDLEPALQALNDQIRQTEVKLHPSRSEIEEAQAAWENAFSYNAWKNHWIAPGVVWSPLEPTEARSENGTSLLIQPDRSVLAQGDQPWDDVYIVHARTLSTNLTAIQLEALTDDSLPDGGPGRAASGIFVLTDFELIAYSVRDPTLSNVVRLANPDASFSQEGWPVTDLLDGNPQTGWAVWPATGRRHWAVFELANFSGYPGGTEFTALLKQKKGNRITLGRFRLSTTESPKRTASPEAAEILRLPSDSRSDEARAYLRNYYRSLDPSLAEIRREIAALTASMKDFNPGLDQAQREWEQDWHRLDGAWTVLDPVSLLSAGGATLQKLPDKSVLASGTSPWEDVYTVVARTTLPNITAIRLEALPDPSLPNNGPGRAGAGNFVLTAFHVSAAPSSTLGDQRWVSFDHASANFIQEGWDIRDTLLGNPERGWAIWPQMGQPHHAVFRPTRPIGFPGGTTLVFFLRQHYGERVTLGRFRLSVTDLPDPPAADPTPAAVAEILRKDPRARTEAERTELTDYYRTIDPGQRATRERLALLNQALHSNNPRLELARAEWERKWLETDGSWTVLDPHQFTAAKGTLLEKLPDRSLLATGPEPWDDVYTIQARTTLTNLSVLRLEVLPDGTLPGGGPGRTAGGNFVLSDFEVSAMPLAGGPGIAKLVLTNATADFSQTGWDIANVLDDDPQTGWAIYPAVGQPHHAVFQLGDFKGFPGGTLLICRLKQSQGNGITLGRFRLSVGESAEPLRADPTPSYLAPILRQPPDERTEEDSAAVAAYYRSIDPETQALRADLADLQKQRIELLRSRPLQIDWIARYPGMASFGVHPATGQILMADMLQGFIRRLHPQENPVVVTPFPAALADTGIFADLATLTPNPGIVPYSINVPFWSDHADKGRWFSIPDTNLTIRFSPQDNWLFPTGSIWIKHFEIELTNGVQESTRRLETRVLVRTEDGAYGVTYKWDPTGTNAFLVPEQGQNETFTVYRDGVARPQTWRYPSRAECLQCHTAVAGYALGFNTAQLNRTIRAPHGFVNQIEALSHAGYFSNPPESTHLLPALAPATDPSISREYRVRSYLHANCVQCHQPDGAGRSLWDARITTPTALAGLIDAPPGHGSLAPDDRIVRPGSVEQSVLMQRLQIFDTRHMPPVGTTELNHEAIELLSAWIREDLPKAETYAQWAQRSFSSESAPEAQPHADPDGDSADNRLEHLTKTDPLDPADRWKLTIEEADGIRRLRFRRPAHLSLQVQFTTDLSDPASWQPLDVPGNRPFYPAEDTEAIIEDARTTEAATFYRVVINGP